MGAGVAEVASTLLNFGVLSASPLPPSSFPCIIPKNSKKVRLILFCLVMNERKVDLPTFHLPPCDGIAQLLASTPRSRPFYFTDAYLTDAFWSLRLPAFNVHRFPVSGLARWPGFCPG